MSTRTYIWADYTIQICLITHQTDYLTRKCLWNLTIWSVLRTSLVCIVGWVFYKIAKYIKLIIQTNDMNMKINSLTTSRGYNLGLTPFMRMTPPFLVRSIQGGFRRYAVRKGSVRSTQKFCYIVRRHQFLL